MLLACWVVSTLTFAKRTSRRMPQIHPFLYAPPRQAPDRPPSIASSRDPQANAHLEKALHLQGYDFGVSVLNFPPKQRSYKLLPIDSLFPVQLPFLVEGDLLFQTTRPPLSDGKHKDKKRVEPSNTTLERATFMHWWRYFGRCARSTMTLRPEVADLLPQGFKNREEMTFHQKGCAYKYLQVPGQSRSQKTPEGDRTAAFLLRVDSLYPGGPGLVGAFGLNAIATLAWCRMLRFRYPNLLKRRGLTMVELIPVGNPERPITDGWMGDWDVEILFDTGGELPPRPEEAKFAIAL